MSQEQTSWPLMPSPKYILVRKSCGATKAKINGRDKDSQDTKSYVRISPFYLFYESCLTTIIIIRIIIIVIIIITVNFKLTFT